jgi:pilus assembly protein CpaB
VASKEIPDGGTLANHNLAKKAVPASGAGQRNIPAAEFERILGTRVRGSIGAGEPVLWSDIEDASTQSRFSRLIPTGRRAMTVDADPLSSFAGLLRPGDRVDILHEPDAGSGFHPLLYNVPVLAVDRSVRVTPDRDEKTEVSTLTLSLLPAESVRVAHASRNGKVSYLLRNPNDRSRPPSLSRARREVSRIEIWKAGIPVGRITFPGGAS